MSFPIRSNPSPSPPFSSENAFANQLHRLAELDGDWHEFESKALRRENERKEKEARRAASSAKDSKSRDRKREPEAHDDRGDAKRVHVEGRPVVPAERSKA